MTTPRGAAPVLILIHEAEAPPEHTERRCCVPVMTLLFRQQEKASPELKDLRCTLLTNRATCLYQLARFQECVEVRQPASLELVLPEEFESSSGLETRTQVP